MCVCVVSNYQLILTEGEVRSLVPGRHAQGLTRTSQKVPKRVEVRAEWRVGFVPKCNKCQWSFLLPKAG